MELADAGLRYRMRRALRQIGEQHLALHEIHERLVSAIASGGRLEARDVFVRFRHAIGAHFELEDGVFFPALHGLHPEEQEALEALGRDHAALLAALQRLVPLLEEAALERFGAAFDTFRRDLAQHEKREEALVSRCADEA
jgi:hemerythrin superfamily protein